MMGGDPPRGGGAKLPGAKRARERRRAWGSREKGASLFTMIPLEPWNLEPRFIVCEIQETPKNAEVAPDMLTGAGISDWRRTLAPVINVVYEGSPRTRLRSNHTRYHG